MAPRARTAELEPQPESDRVGELPHPRERLELFGHTEAVRTLAESARSGRLHHAWIIAGPKGVGKATLAWRFARALLAHGAKNCPDDLSVADDHPIQRQLAAMAHSDLILVRRPWDPDRKRFRVELPVEEVRRLHGFYSRHSAQGGARIAIVDAADDMNRSAQNALLKILEEPPARALLLLVSHAPGGLLPTTRSRCRMLTLRRLDDTTMRQALAALAPKFDDASRAQLSALADGAPGRALELAETDALSMYREIGELLMGLPRLNGARLFGLAEKVAKAPAERGLILFVTLLLQLEERLLRGSYAALPPVPGEEALLRHLGAAVPLERWGQLWDALKAEALRADDLNLDKKQLVLSTFFAIEAASQR
ncbi:MAG: DNA polymerase III subunit delta' [Alphaproteobacteria bacterium]|nr:DNA polymerase III subunit delta' [Alphaproteobacteria bacterium]